MLSERNIFITKNLAEHLNDILPNYSKQCVIVDENTKTHCLPLVQSLLPNAHIIEITSGEEEKNLTTCQFIWEEMTNQHLDRKSIVINLGGGVIGDMGGFCASCYKRGIDFIQIPTTLLSQVDASVGGKLGIDFHHFKNHIGIFREPRAVLINTDFLNTLPTRELRSGFAEIIKHALIADKAKWVELSTKSLEEQNWDELAAHSVQIKAHITEEDPLEKGLRKILNFGHTIGHAIESFYLPTEKKLLHGEAIAIGMIAEAYVAHKKGFISLDDVGSIKKYVISIYDHPKIAEVDFHEIVPLTLQDKKNEGGTVLASLLERIGKANFNIEIDAEDITLALRYYNE